MDYVYEEDLQISVARVKELQKDLEMINLELLFKKLERKIEDMSDVWGTSVASFEMEEIKEFIEKIEFDKMKLLLNSIREIDVRYDFDIMSISEQ